MSISRYTWTERERLPRVQLPTASPKKAPTPTYRIDAADVISRVGQSWSAGRVGNVLRASMTKPRGILGRSTYAEGLGEGVRGRTKLVDGPVEGPGVGLHPRESGMEPLLCCIDPAGRSRHRRVHHWAYRSASVKGDCACDDRLTFGISSSSPNRGVHVGCKDVTMEGGDECGTGNRSGNVEAL